MAPKTQVFLCKIIFGELRISVWNQEKGKRFLERTFMIGESGEEGVVSILFIRDIAFMMSCFFTVSPFRF
jgi:hypothetical protein